MVQSYPYSCHQQDKKPLLKARYVKGKSRFDYRGVILKHPKGYKIKLYQYNLQTIQFLLSDWTRNVEINRWVCELDDIVFHYL